MRGGRPLSRGYIYKLLSNPLYVGRIAHKEETYDGLHPPIIDTETWDAVQAKLAANTSTRSSGGRATEPSPLMGKLFDEAGAPLTPSHAVKSGRRYRYYVSRRLISKTVGADTGKDGWRLPAREIERVVDEAVGGLLADRTVLTDAAREQGIAADRIPDLLQAVARWRGPVLNLVERVDLGGGKITIGVNLAPFTGQTEMTVRHSIPARIRRRGVEMRLVLDGAGTQTARPDPALIKAVVRAHKWFEDLATGRVPSLSEIAKKEGVSDRYVSHLIPLAFLAPDIVEVILAGTQPADLTAETLIKRVKLPLSWADQHTQLGFD